MRSFSLLKEAMLPYFEVLINNLASKLMLVSKVKDIFCGIILSVKGLFIKF